MTGTAKVKPPKNNAELARNHQRRLEQVENPTSSRMGDWVFSTQPDTGNLIASYVNGGSVVIAIPPEVAEEQADTVTSNLPAVLRLNRVVAQAAGTISWDTPVIEQGDWGVALPTTDITVPVAGNFLICVDVYSTSAQFITRSVGVRVNGISIMLDEQSGDVSGDTANADSHDHLAGDLVVNVFATFHLAQVFPLQVGDLVQVVANSTGNIGPSGIDPNIVTTISLTQVGI